MRVVAVVLALLALSGCASPFRVADINPATQRFGDSESTFAANEIKLSRGFPGVRDVSFVYLRTRSDFRPAEFHQFVRESLGKIGFPKVVTEPELTQLVIKGGFTDRVQDLHSPLSLNRLAQIVGPFLVVETTMYRGIDVIWQVDAVVYDPVAARPMFVASRRKVNWMSLSNEFALPLANSLKAWFDESASLPAPAKAPASDQRGI